METFLYALHAIMPILLTIAAGYLVRRIGPWDDGFYRKLNALCFRFFLPVQLFYNVYNIDSLKDVKWGIIIFLVASVVVDVMIGILLSIPLIRDPQKKGPFVQASFRSNQAVIGIPLATALGGSLAFTSLATSIGVPMYNFFAVLVLSYYSGSRKRSSSPLQLIRTILTNPLIIGSLLGLFCVIVRRWIPSPNDVPLFSIQSHLPSVYSAIASVSKVATPAMLFCLGARLDFRAFGNMIRELTAGVLMRLLLIPGIVITLAVLFAKPLGITAAEMPTIVAFTASPCAVSGAVMTQEIGGDDQYASQLVVWSSALSMLTIFLIVILLRTFSLI